MDQKIAWPAKSREFRNHHFDSTVWNDFRFRDDDIVIATYAKSGTTWMQQIVAQLVFDGDPDIDVAQRSPWLDLRYPSKGLKLLTLEAQTHRRFIKTHLPIDALVFSPKAKYLYIGRDGRDVVWSMYNHHANATQQWYDNLNKTPGLVGPPIERPTADIHQYWHEWMAGDGHPWWPFWENVRGWWAARHLPNVMFVHFVDLKRDMAGEIRRIADFLDIPVDGPQWETILHHCSFDWMKQNAARHVGGGGDWLAGGAETFINKGVNGRWADTLTAGDVAEYEARARAELGEDCARWLKEGGAIG
ncbi:MAG: sulfotransferase domain-containing protein [Moraxellaceae bacterium]|nr:sulfotransferase domain-containing protein [Moraxellaceae bacterium]